MEELSNKALIVYTALDLLGATDNEHKVHAYTILDYISESDELQEDERLKDISEQDFVDIIMEISIKSVNTLIASMCRKGIIIKTEPQAIKVEGQKRNLRQYYIKK